MSKKRQEKRRLKAKKNKRRQLPKQKIATPGSAAPHSTAPSIPSAHTMWRSINLDFRNQETIAKALAQSQPSVLQRDAARIEQIQNAANVEAVLDLTPIATGLADFAWTKRMRDFGPTVAKNIAARLNSDWLHAHGKERSGIQERCIGALRWYGEEGGDALLSCWDSLDDYGQSIASIAFGLLGTRRAADRIFDFYQKAQSQGSENHFVGALWGLINLQDERAGDALLELLKRERAFYELFGFLSLAGDKRAVIPLFVRAAKGSRSSDEILGDAMWALLGIAHRIGRADLMEELNNALGPTKIPASELEHLADHIFKFSIEDVKNHFQIFYATEALEFPIPAKPGGKQLRR